ncbi:MAG: MATE family efflux transporter [Clostridia bacterium]|nr:MATE family efflux transporter [Clostridia bacterium]
MAKFENDLSRGNVVKQLILFSLPFLLSNLIQTLYSVVDMIVVGQFAGTASMSGVNIGSQVTMLITNMVLGLSVGATVLIGQYLGAGDRKALKETIGTLLSTLIVLAAIITVVMIVVQEPLLRLIKTPAESFSEAKAYFFITMTGTIFIFGYNALSAIMRGMGDSKNPLIFVAIACAINIFLDVWFVCGLKMGASGAALATVISQAVSMVLCIIYLSKNNFIFDFKLSSFAFHKERLKLLLKIGVPTSVQNIATSVSFLFLTTLVNSLGVVASAAVGAVGKLNGFAILPAVAMSSSVSAMAAQNIGAGKIDRAKKTMFTGMAIGMTISVIVFAIFNLFPEALLKIFGDDAEMIKKGAVYIHAFSFDYLIVPMVFCFNGLFIGAGHTTFSLFNSCVSSIFGRIPAAYILGMVLDLGLFGFGLGAPIASLISFVLGFVFYVSGKWKKMTIIK